MVTRRFRIIPVLALLLFIVGCTAHRSSVASRSTEPSTRPLATTKPSFEGDAALSLDDIKPIPRLKRAGATGIITYPLNKVIP